MSRRPVASLSLDLDDEWAYLLTRGERAWTGRPSFLGRAVPRSLELLAHLGLRVTYFVVGFDAAQSRNRELLRSVADAGHAIGNHSFGHEPWLNRYTRPQLVTELTMAEEAIEQATGVHPTGFRGPGHSLTADVVEVLSERGYRYDASTLPTTIGPLARARYFRTAQLDDAQRTQRGLLFGTFRDGLRPLRPYDWQVQRTGAWLLEIPVTTMPLLRVPIHVSYLLWLASSSPMLAKAYFRTALELCAASGVSPSVMLHPLDVLDCADVPSLGFFPAMSMAAPRKAELVADLLTMLSGRFEVVSVDEHADRLLQGGERTDGSRPSSSLRCAVR